MMKNPCNASLYMNEINSGFIQRYEEIIEKDPTSKIFAPLCEAYRKNGELERALKIAEQGVHFHPHFASGLVAYAKVLIELGKKFEALKHLQKATQLSPENILGQTLLADLALDLRMPKDALKAFKMVLFLNPQDQRAINAVKKLESLTADEYAEDVFAMKPLAALNSSGHKENDFLTKALDSSNNARNSSYSSPSEYNSVAYGAGNKAVRIRGLERLISLADAFIARNDVDRAMETLEKSRREYGDNPEITFRFEMLAKRGLEPIPVESIDSEEPAETIKPLPSRIDMVKEQKLRVLENLLHRVNEKRFG